MPETPTAAALLRDLETAKRLLTRAGTALGRQEEPAGLTDEIDAFLASSAAPARFKVGDRVLIPGGSVGVVKSVGEPPPYSVRVSFFNGSSVYEPDELRPATPSERTAAGLPEPTSSAEPTPRLPPLPAQAGDALPPLDDALRAMRERAERFQRDRDPNTYSTWWTHALADFATTETAALRSDLAASRLTASLMEKARDEAKARAEQAERDLANVREAHANALALCRKERERADYLHGELARAQVDVAQAKKALAIQPPAVEPAKTQGADRSCEHRGNAFGPNGNRCALDAGHAGPHTINEPPSAPSPAPGDDALVTRVVIAVDGLCAAYGGFGSGREQRLHGARQDLHAALAALSSREGRASS